MAFRAIATCSLLLCALTASAATVANPPQANMRRAVVSVRVTGQDFHWKTPWTKHPPWTRASNGLVVQGKRILTAADSVGNQTLVEVQKLGEQQRYQARVVLVDYEAGLGLLEVDDASFWDGLAPAPLAEVAPKEGEVTIQRWLDSGQFEVATGTVRQVRSDSHGVSRTDVLSLDVSSNIQQGGLAEVVVVGGQVVGLTTDKMGDQLAAVASPFLRQFLAAAQEKPYRGFGRAGMTWQRLLNPALRDSLGLRSDEGGILVTRVLPHGTAGTGLENGDVLLELGGVRIDGAGQFEHAQYGKLAFAMLFTDGRRPGDKLVAKVLRQGQRKEVPLTVKRMQPQDDRIFGYSYDEQPQYAIHGGLVFQDLSVPYLSTHGDWRRRGPLRLVIAQELEGSFPTEEHPRVVLMTHVLPDQANLGYQDYRDLIVTQINGMPVRTLDDVNAAFAKPRNGFHVVEFQPGQTVRRVVLDAAEVEASRARVAEQYGTGAPR
ncbi:MAG: hypothetical protein AB2A00_05695 [Myxococcota bacterium]